MRRVFNALAVAVVLLLGGVLVVLGQGGAVRLLEPVVVRVDQAVPAVVSLAGVVDGQAVTLTAPVTVAVQVEVRIAGSGAVRVTAGPASQAGPGQAEANDAAVLAQLDAFDAACSAELTRAQQQKALGPIAAYFEGRDVALVGTIDDVRDLSGEFDVLVTLDGTSRVVRMKGLSEAQALALHKGQAVRLVGTVDASGCYAYVTVVGVVEAVR